MEASVSDLKLYLHMHVIESKMLWIYKSQLVLVILCIMQSESTKKLSPCDVAALEKCLKENKGDHKKVID